MIVSPVTTKLHRHLLISNVLLFIYLNNIYQVPSIGQTVLGAGDMDEK